MPEAGRVKQGTNKEEAQVGKRLTYSDCSHHRGHDGRKGHSTSNHQVPLVVGNIFTFIAVMNLPKKKV